MKKVAGVVMAVAATAALASCEKPPPRVTFVTGTTSEWVAPTCFSWDGQVDAQQCPPMLPRRLPAVRRCA